MCIVLSSESHYSDNGLVKKLTNSYIVSNIVSVSFGICGEVVGLPGVLISPYHDQEGNKLGSMSGTGAISTISRREPSSRFFFSPRQDAEGNSRHFDRNVTLFPSWSG